MGIPIYVLSRALRSNSYGQGASRVRDAKQSKQWHKIYLGARGVCEQGALVSWGLTAITNSKQIKILFGP